MSKVLIACEESQVVCKAFRSIGYEAYSCDIQDCSGGRPEWHIKGDAVEEAYSGKYEMMIAHPPCTYLSKAGARWMYPTAGVICEYRLKQAKEAKSFFMSLLDAPVNKICVENPTPLKVAELPPHTQVIQPYEYGDPYSKRTLLWLKGLPPLEPEEVLTHYNVYLPSNTGGKKRGHKATRGVAKNAKEASKTFPGIAKAMARQWGTLINE
jgi:hypothetical protein